MHLKAANINKRFEWKTCIRMLQQGNENQLKNDVHK